ncbi:MAG: hypothetical protein R3C53_15010 [Pirellulaceae bacterium]
MDRVAAGDTGILANLQSRDIEPHRIPPRDSTTDMEEVPFEDRRVPRVEIDWDRSIWWWYPLTRVIQPAVRMTSLALSLLALLITAGWIAVGERLFDPRWESEQLHWFASNFDRVGGSSSFTPSIVVWLNYLVQVIRFEAFGFRELAFVTFEILFIATTFALLGGVLARRGAVELGQRTVAPWGESFRIVFSRWASYLWASGMHFVGIAVLLLPAMLLGLINRLGSVGEILAGIGLLLTFPLVFAVGRFALSAIVCFPLSVCAICVEKRADAFEGFSRSNAYFFQRPFVAALCCVMLLVVGVVGEQIVYWVLQLGWWLVHGSFAFTAGDESSKVLLIGAWVTKMLIGAYWFSFFWSAAAAAYLILRRSVDNCELDEMDSIESEVETSLPDIPAVSQAAQTT